MKYPTVNDYLSSISSMNKHCDKLKNFRPICDKYYYPIYIIGEHSIVFKVTNGKKIYALKCYTEEISMLKERYHIICNKINNMDSKYLMRVYFYDNEICVDTNTECRFPVVVMEWARGITLDKYLLRLCNSNGYEYIGWVDTRLQEVCDNVSRMFYWLLKQDFSHGNIEPGNIIIYDDDILEIKLIDYDNMFFPEIEKFGAAILGNVNYRHPKMTLKDFDEHLDDFSAILLTTCTQAIANEYRLFERYKSGNALIFKDEDLVDFTNNKKFQELKRNINKGSNPIFISVLQTAYEIKKLPYSSYEIFNNLQEYSECNSTVEIVSKIDWQSCRESLNLVKHTESIDTLNFLSNIRIERSVINEKWNYFQDDDIKTFLLMYSYCANKIDLNKDKSLKLIKGFCRIFGVPEKYATEIFNLKLQHSDLIEDRLKAIKSNSVMHDIFRNIIIFCKECNVNVELDFIIHIFRGLSLLTFDDIVSELIKIQINHPTYESLKLVNY